MYTIDTAFYFFHTVCLFVCFISSSLESFCLISSPASEGYVYLNRFIIKSLYKPKYYRNIGSEYKAWLHFPCQPKHARQLYVLDVNDNPPIFQSKSYSATVSEVSVKSHVWPLRALTSLSKPCLSFQATAVGSNVLTVTAIDADGTTENKRLVYSILVSIYLYIWNMQ